MPEAMARIIVYLIGTYLVLGLLFGIPCVFRWLGRLDPVAESGTWGFRLLVLPGTVAFWPLLLSRLVRRVPGPPEERNAHRAASGRKEPS